MKICDRCEKPVKATAEIHIPIEDSYFDLCSKHFNEIVLWLSSKEKPKRN